LASYGGNKESIVYVWKSLDPIQMTRSLYLLDYTLYGYGESYCDVITPTGEYSCAQAEFLFERAPSTTVMTVMVPSCMWIVVAWLALWLNRDQMVGRLFLVCLSLYALSQIARQVQAEVPRVAYTKAIDTWTGTCVLFAFVALLEVLIIGCLDTSVTKKEEEGSQWRGPAFLHRLRSSHWSHKLEIAFRILNPLIFVLLFITPYFVTYAVRSTKPCGYGGNITFLRDTVCE
jgi:anionic glutamate receptor